MIRRIATIRLLAVPVFLAALLSAACEKVPLLAPTGSSITLTTATTALAANGSATIIAQVLEAAGTPPHSGTRVTFITTLGVLDPPEASTDASGRAVVTFRGNGVSGVAEINATSGAATTSTGSSTTSTTGGTTTAGRNLTIFVGTAAVGRVLMAANPAVLPTAGGATTITANVVDRNGNALASTPVAFTTSAGTLSTSVSNTDDSGNASVTLTTFQPATVTGTVGLGSTGSGTGGDGSTTTGNNAQASVSVSLTSAPTLQITAPVDPPSAGLPALFTFRVTPATSGSGGSGSGGTTGGTSAPTPIRELIIDWGDGGPPSNLGAVSGEQGVTHTFRSAGSFVVTATVTDVAGGTARVATSVVVIPVPRPTIIITPTPQSAVGGTPINFRIEISAPNGLAISNVVINFGDGTSQALGGATGIIPVLHIYPVGAQTYSVFVTVTDSTGQSTVGSTVVTITL